MPQPTPHGFCLAWTPALLWLHVVSDAVIAASSYSIPVALGYAAFLRVRTRRLGSPQRHDVV